MCVGWTVDFERGNVSGAVACFEDRDVLVQSPAVGLALRVHVFAHGEPDFACCAAGIGTACFDPELDFVDDDATHAVVDALFAVFPSPGTPVFLVQLIDGRLLG